MSHVEYQEESVSTSLKNQYIAACIISLSTFCYGIGVGWVSPSLDYLVSNESRYGAPLTSGQLGSVASLFCVGGLLGTFIFGFTAERYGRKWTGLMSAVPFILSWVLKLTVTNYEGLLAARILSGIGGGGSLLIAPLYCLEIGSVRVRGALGSIPPLALNAGVLFAYSVGAAFHYYHALWIHLSIPIIYVIAFYFMPETPAMLVKMNKTKEVVESIAWLRNTTVEDTNVQIVLSNVKLENDLANKKQSQIIGKHEITQTGETKYTSNNDPPNWKIFVTSRSTWLALMMGFTIIAIYGFVGIFALVTFASDIFHEAGSTLAPNVAAIIISVTQLIGSYISVILIERWGRKTLLTISCTIVGFCLMMMGTHFYLLHNGFDLTSYGWIPVTVLSIGILIDAIGVGPVSLVIINEIFMIQVREMAVTFLVSFIWIFEFIQTEFYAPTVSIIGSSGMFWFFGTVGLFGGAFCFLFVPETKNKPLSEILKHFDKKVSRQTQV